MIIYGTKGFLIQKNKIIINNNETFLKTQTILLKKRLKKY